MVENVSLPVDISKDDNVRSSWLDVELGKKRDQNDDDNHSQIETQFLEVVPKSFHKPNQDNQNNANFADKINSVVQTNKDYTKKYSFDQPTKRQAACDQKEIKLITETQVYDDNSDAADHRKIDKKLSFSKSFSYINETNQHQDQPCMLVNLEKDPYRNVEIDNSRKIFSNASINKMGYVFSKDCEPTAQAILFPSGMNKENLKSTLKSPSILQESNKFSSNLNQNNTRSKSSSNLIQTDSSGDSSNEHFFDAPEIVLEESNDKNRQRRKGHAIRKSVLPAVHFPKFKKYKLPTSFLWMGWIVVFSYFVFATSITVVYGIQVSYYKYIVHLWVQNIFASFLSFIFIVYYLLH